MFVLALCNRRAVVAEVEVIAELLLREKDAFNRPLTTWLDMPYRKRITLSGSCGDRGVECQSRASLLDNRPTALYFIGSESRLHRRLLVSRGRSNERHRLIFFVAVVFGMGGFAVDGKRCLRPSNKILCKARSADAYRRFIVSPTKRIPEIGLAGLAGGYYLQNKEHTIPKTNSPYPKAVEWFCLNESCWSLSLSY